METLPSSESVWDQLPQHLQEHYEVWRSLSEQVSAAHPEDGAHLYESIALPYLRLIPLVEVLKNYSSLRRLYPFTSHQWLRFSTMPPWMIGGNQSEVCAAALGEDRFIVRRQLHSALPARRFEDLGEGPASQMAQLIVDEVDRESALK